MKNELRNFSDILIPAAKGFAVSVIAAAVLIFVVSAVAYSAGDPDSVIRPLALAALYISCAVGGIVSARLSGEHGAVAALVSAAAGLMLLICVIFLSFIPTAAPDRALSPALSVALHALIVAVSAACGMIFRPKKKRTHRRRR